MRYILNIIMANHSFLCHREVYRIVHIKSLLPRLFPYLSPVQLALSGSGCSWEADTEPHYIFTFLYSGYLLTLKGAFWQLHRKLYVMFWPLSLGLIQGFERGSAAPSSLELWTSPKIGLIVSFTVICKTLQRTI